MDLDAHPLYPPVGFSKTLENTKVHSSWSWAGRTSTLGGFPQPSKGTYLKSLI